MLKHQWKLESLEPYDESFETTKAAVEYLKKAVILSFGPGKSKADQVVLNDDCIDFHL